MMIIMHSAGAETPSYPPKFVLPLFLSNRVTEIIGLPSQGLHFPALFQLGDYEATNGNLNTSQVCSPTLGCYMRVQYFYQVILFR